MAARRHERTYARKQAIQVLYQSEILDAAPSALLQNDASFIDGAKPSQYAMRLVSGIEEHRDQIDELVGTYAENWSVDRMPSVDRAIMRLACYEMAYVDEVPISVSINEAVDLAKEFGGEDESHRFVNGVLGRIAVHLQEQDGEAAAGEAEAEAAEAEADGEAEAAGAAETVEPEGVVDGAAEPASEGGR